MAENGGMFFGDSLVFAALGGILPAIVWLWFWLAEDRLHPEPRRLVALAFLGGMLSVAVVIPLQEFAQGLPLAATSLLITWVVIEEVLKYLAARTTVLWRASVDEPIDPMIYMISTALGFAAVENTLFILNPLQMDDIGQTLLTGNLRFIGATLMHVLASATVGAALAFSFYKSRRIRTEFVLGGLVLAVALHSGFNLFIIGSNGQKIFTVFFCVWLGIVLLILLFERAKRIGKPYPRLPPKRP